MRKHHYAFAALGGERTNDWIFANQTAELSSPPAPDRFGVSIGSGHGITMCGSMSLLMKARVDDDRLRLEGAVVPESAGESFLHEGMVVNLP